MHPITAAPDWRVDDYGEQVVMWIAPPGHRFARLRAITGADMLAEDYVSYGRHSVFDRWLEDAFARSGTRLRTTIEAPASPSPIEVVRLGA